MRDPYLILGVSKFADLQEIKAAWRAAAKIYHPDQNPGDPTAAARFQEISRAYDLLKDPQKRRRYDEAQRRAQASSNYASSSASTPGANRSGKEKTFMERRAEKAREEAEARAAEAKAAAAAAAAAAAMNPEAGEAEIQEAEDVVSRIFGSRKTAQASAGSQQAQGQAQAHAQQTAQSAAYSAAAAQSYAAAAGRTERFASSSRSHVEEAYTGADHGYDNTKSPARDLLGYLFNRLTRQAPPPEKAPDLAMNAWISIEDLYKRKNPTLTLPDGKLVSVTLPADAREGMEVRLEGYGHKLPNMKRGDVVATLRVQNHKWYRTDGYDLIVVHPVDIENAVLGTRASVETPAGMVDFAIPEWSGSDRVITVPGKGLPKSKTDSGDLKVELRVRLWDHKDQKVIDLMRSLREGLYL